MEIKVCYGDKPLPKARKAVERLLAGIPQKYLRGLKTVVLRDTASLSHNRKRKKTWSRKKKVRIREAAGLYHQTWKGEPAWIEIFVDNVLYAHKDDVLLRVGLRIPFTRDLIFAGPVYHEVGHHIHKTQMPEYKEREDVAEQWRRKLIRHYFGRTYWYIVIPILLVAWPILKARNMLRKRRREKHVHGISQRPHGKVQ